MLFISDSIYKILGYIFLLFGLFLLFVGIGMAVDPLRTPSGVEPSSTGIAVAIVSNIFILPGIFFFIKGKKKHREEMKLKNIANIINSYKGISIDELSEKSKIDKEEIPLLIAEAIKLHLISGYFDRTTNEFFTEDSQKKEVQIKYCPSCGSKLDKTYLKGDTIKCDHCGTIIH